jgi:cytochrome c biogenesis factor
MTTLKKLITISLFLLLCLPVKVSFAQNMSTESETTVQVDENNSSEKKADKKKEKEKDAIQINEKFFISLGINIATVILLITLVYYPNNRKMDYIFTFIIFNIVIFLLTFVLNKVKMSMGAAFGLFAVFSMLRYRTEGISMKDMTYLFIFIGLGLISAIQLEYYELGILSGIIMVTTYILDGNFLIKRELSKSIQYEDIEMIKPENYDKLIEDLQNRTGIKIHRITINKINFLKDTAIIRIFYYE